jgi:hypothetical protein
LDLSDAGEQTTNSSTDGSKNSVAMLPSHADRPVKISRTVTFITLG